MSLFGKSSELIGNTPLLRLQSLEEHWKLPIALLAKLEYYNMAGSVKTRVAKAMLDAAEQQGLLRPGAVIIEPTSGNTGIGLAAIGKARGYRVLLTMPDTMSSERCKLLRAYGAELVQTDGALGMRGAIQKAAELAAEVEGSFIPGQFNNSANPTIHQQTTGPEIWHDSSGAVDIFVAGVGTGGTITGVGRYLRQQKPTVEIVAVEPAASPILSKGTGGSHGIQGIGAGFVPKVLDTHIYNEVIAVTEKQSIEMARLLAAKEGLFVGISSGAALWACIELAKRPQNSGKTIATLFPDAGERYMSTGLLQ